MPKSNFLDNAYLKILLQGVALANFWDNASVSPVATLYVALHTADPGVGGLANTNEVSYGGYARVATARSSSAWSITGDIASPVATISFPTASSGSTTATYFSISAVASGAGQLLYIGTITPNITITTGVRPELTTLSTITES